MKIIYNKFLPLKGFQAINLFGIIFVRKEIKALNKRVLNHEYIHTKQIIELLFIGFYIWYITEWLIKWIFYKDRMLAYRNISFEREAFDNDDNLNYTKSRKRFAFLQYLKK